MKSKITGFANGLLSLLISQILIKIFGVIYSLYMTNKGGFGDTGNAIYMSGYQIYALILTISSIGVPNSISKLISEKDSIDDYKNANRIFNISIIMFSIMGFTGCLLMFFLSGFIAENILLIPETKLSLMILSPAILFVSIASVIRGYCNGKGKIAITAKSQFLEQVLKSIFTIFFVEFISKKSNNNVELMATSANGATTVATFFSLIYIIIKYKLINKGIKEKRVNYFQYENINIILKKIILISAPITVSALLTSISKNIDSITIVRILKKFFSEGEAIKKYGIISSKVDILIAFPLSFNTAISTVLIPEISRNIAKNNINKVTKKIKSSLFLTLIIVVPSAFGMYFYSEEIFWLLFPKAIMGAEILRIASVSIIFSGLAQTLAGALQGLGKNSIPLYATIFGILGKIICNIVFINIKGIYEKGAIIGNIVLSIIMFLFEYIYLNKYIYIRSNMIKNAFLPTIFSIIMIIVSKNIYNYLNIKIDNNISILVSIIICIIIYIILFMIYLLNVRKKQESPGTVENTRMRALGMREIIKK